VSAVLGRPPSAGGVAAAGLVGAIDIGASKTLVTVRSRPLTEWKHGTGARGAPVARLDTGRDPRAFVERLVETLTDLARGADGKLVAVGCAAPGPLDPDGGVIIRSPNQGWRDVPIIPWLGDSVGVPAVLEDDARAGALGEGILGAGRGADPVVYVTVSSGIGSGLLLGGEIHRGGHGLAGEFGHLTVDPRGPRCGCGRRGCVESFAGGGSMARRARATWPRGTLRDGSRAPVDAEGVFRAARSGDPDAAAIADDAVEALARGLASLAAVLDPQAIVVGGSLALGQRGFIRRSVSRARQRCMAESGAALTVRRAALGGESALAGAALLAERLAARLGPGSEHLPPGSRP